LLTLRKKINKAPSAVALRKYKKKYKQTLKLWRSFSSKLRSYRRSEWKNKFKNAALMTDPLLNPRATSQLWSLVNKYSKPRSPSLKTIVLSQEQLSLFYDYWKAVWDRHPLSHTRRQLTTDVFNTWMENNTNISFETFNTLFKTKQCASKTLQGKRCRKTKTHGSLFCYIHKNRPFLADPTPQWSIVMKNNRTWLCDNSEVSQALVSMKMNRAGGVSKTTVDMLTMAPLQHIANIINHVLTTFSYPKEWEQGILCLIFKGSGDKNDPSNYRPIQLTEAMFRLTEMVIWRRLKPIIEPKLRNEQGGFRSRRGTLEQLFLLSTAIDITKKRGENLFVACLDIKKAFDSADHDSILYKLALRHADKQTCKLLKCLLSNHKTILQQQFEVPIRCGVLQGGILSPVLFNIFIDDLLPHSLCSQHGVSIGYTSIAVLLYADDIVLLSSTHEGLQELLNSTYAWSTDWGITFNPSKCSVLIFGETTPFNFNLGGTPLATVNSTTLLGITINNNATYSRKQDSTKDLLNKLSFILRGNVPVPTILGSNIWFSQIEPRLLYGTEIFNITNEEIKIQRRTARVILGVPQHTSSAATFEFLTWPRIETTANQRFLLFARRLKYNQNELIKEAFELNLNNELSWSKRLMKLLQQLNLLQAWETDESDWKKLVIKVLFEKEQQYWKEKVYLNDESVNFVKQPPPILRNGEGIGAKHAFFFRYDFTSHFLRHEKLRHFNTDCPLCYEPLVSPYHLATSCNATSCSTIHQQVIKKSQDVIRQALNIYAPTELERRLLILTGAKIKLDPTTATKLQKAMACIQRLRNFYAEKMPTLPAPPPSTIQLPLSGVEWIVALFEKTTYEDIRHMYEEILQHRGVRTIRRWFNEAKHQNRVPQGITSLNKYMEQRRKAELYIEYSNLRTRAQKERWKQDNVRDRTAIARWRSYARKYGLL
jgi:hypothetical protein